MTEMQQKLVTNSQNLTETKLELAITKQELAEVKKKDPIPIGYIYKQLPFEKMPNELWPWTHWNEVSSTYAGVFFRVVGGDAKGFNATQAENSPRVTSIDFSSSSSESTYFSVSLTPGFWSNYANSGGYDGHWVGMKFYVSSGEVRPRNMAIRIWKRIA